MVIDCSPEGYSDSTWEVLLFRGSFFGFLVIGW